jgi:hypothetical protein
MIFQSSVAAPGNHHSEPMHKAAAVPSVNRMPSGTISSMPASSSSAAAAATATALDPTSITADALSDKDLVDALTALNQLGFRTGGNMERRDVEALTSSLAALNKISKRDPDFGGNMDDNDVELVAKRGKLDTPQLNGISGIVDTVTGAASAAEKVTNLAGSLAKRDSEESLEAKLAGNAATAIVSNAGASGGSQKRSSSGLSGLDQMSAALSSMHTGSAVQAEADEDVPPQADIMQGLREGHNLVDTATKDAAEKAPIEKRGVVPPISGSTGLSALTGLLSNPTAAMTTVTQGLTLLGASPMDVVPKVPKE